MQDIENVQYMDLTNDEEVDYYRQLSIEILNNFKKELFALCQKHKVIFGGSEITMLVGLPTQGDWFIDQVRVTGYKATGTKCFSGTFVEKIKLKNAYNAKNNNEESSENESTSMRDMMQAMKKILN